MLKRLRRKIVLINMAFVGVVLIAVFSAVCITSYQSLKSDIYHSLQLATEQRGDKPEPPLADEKKDNFPKQNLIAVCTVMVDDSGTIKQSYQNTTFLSDELLSEAAKAAFAAKTENGSLSAYSLFYQKRSFFGGTKIAFADSEYLYSSLRQLIFTSLLIGGCSMVAIFFISLFLSKLAVRPVEKAWKQQQQFVADASHELKTPLTVILANNNILLSHINDTVANQKKWLDSTGEEAEHMRKLIDNMLFLAQGDAGQTPAIQIPVHFSELVWSVLLQFEPIAYEKQIELDSDIQPELYIKGDTTQLKQLIHIFLDNGCKYAGSTGRCFCGCLASKIMFCCVLAIPELLFRRRNYRIFLNGFIVRIKQECGKAALAWDWRLPKVSPRIIQVRFRWKAHLKQVPSLRCVLQECYLNKINIGS